MTDQDLNRKLAEWAGFTWVATKVYVLPRGWRDGYWISSKSRTRYCNVPNFTSSLDACFKWLVPNVKGVITLTSAYKGWLVSINLGSKLVAAGGNGETPALALCKAIEKLIDEEASHE